MLADNPLAQARMAVSVELGSLITLERLATFGAFRP
jgi:hypothetical protein